MGLVSTRQDMDGVRPKSCSSLVSFVSYCKMARVCSAEINTSFVLCKATELFMSGCYSNGNSRIMQATVRHPLNSRTV